MRGLQRALRFRDARIQLGQIGVAGLAALGRIQVFGVRGARRRQQPAHLARLLQHVEQRQFLCTEIGRPRMLNSQARLLREAVAAETGLIQNPLLDLAHLPRRPPAARRRTRHRAARAADRSAAACAFRARRRAPSSISTVQRTFFGLPSSFAAHELSIGSAVARTEVLAAAQPVATGGLPLKSCSTRCVSGMPERGVRATSSSGAGASPVAIALSVLARRDVLPRTI